MVRIVRLLIVLCLVGIAAFSAAVPKVLIFQTLVPVKRDVDPNVHLANLLASEFDQGGKLEAIVWNMTDPRFRAALMSGRLKEVQDPKLADILNGARSLEADFVLMVESVREGKKCRAKIELFRAGKSVFKDDQNLTINSESGIDLDDSARSLARTFVLRMDQAPLKDLTVKPTVNTPDLTPGQTPAQVVVTPAAPPKKDNAPTIKQARDMVAAGQTSVAIIQLRDAVDSDPADAELRLALIEILLESDPEAAATEARNAANVIPDHPQLRVMAARAWMAAGRPEEAQIDLNEAIVRNPDAVETRLLLGEVAIAQNKPDSAIEHLNQAVSANDSSEARFLLAFAKAMLGQATAMASELDAMKKIEPSADAAATQRRYRFSSAILDESLQTDANEVRALIQRAIVKPDDKVVLTAVDDALQRVRGRTAFADALATPEKSRPVHEQRLLAYKLMAQALSGIQSYMASGREEALAGARIDLGEALRNAAEVRASDQK